MLLTLPNILTLMNLLSGSLAIYAIFYESPVAVIVFFALALVFDFLDGLTARALKIFSPIGKDLDSLADLISFGLFPTFLTIDILERSVNPGEMPVYALVFLLVAGAGLRLAKFNNISESRSGFEGMPTPAMALIVFAIWLNLDNERFPALEFLSNPVFILLLSIFLSFLMNLPIPFIKFTLTAPWNIHRIGSIGLSILFIISFLLDWKLAVLITAIGYLLFSLLIPFLVRKSS